MFNVVGCIHESDMWVVLMEMPEVVGCVPEPLSNRQVKLLLQAVEYNSLTYEWKERIGSFVKHYEANMHKWLFVFLLVAGRAE